MVRYFGELSSEEQLVLLHVLIDEGLLDIDLGLTPAAEEHIADQFVYMPITDEEVQP